MANPLDYSQAIEAFRAYYTSASSADAWNLINTYNLQPAQLYEILPEAHQLAYARQIANAQQIANSTPFQIVSNSGAPQYAVANLPVPVGDGGVAESIFNSNTQYGSASSTFTSSQVASPYQVGDTIQYMPRVNLYNGGQSAGQIPALASQVTQGIAAVATGLSLGKKFDAALYEANPNFWDSIGLSTLNPATWSSITSDMADTGAEGAAKTVLNLLLGIKPNGDTQAYLKKDAYEYLTYAMAQAGMFDVAGEYDIPGGVESNYNLSHPVSVLQPGAYMYGGSGNPYSYIFMGVSHGYAVNIRNSRSDRWLVVAPDDNIPVVATIRQISGDHSTAPNYNTVTMNPAITTITINGQPYTVRVDQLTNYNNTYTGFKSTAPATITTNVPSSTYHGALAAYYIYNGTTSTTVPGVGDQPNANTPPITSADPPSAIPSKIAGTLPYLNDNRLEVPVLQPDGSITNDIYYPIPLPISRNDEGQPTGDPEQNIQQSSTNEDSPEDEIALLLKLLLQRFSLSMPEPQTDPETDTPTETPPTTNPPNTGSGTTPPLIVPTGSASALWAVYNPSLAELNQFGGWLWSNNFVDQLLKLFNDPMQAIIGLHKTFIPPITGERRDIIVGYLSSGVSCLTVPTQYSTVDCGTVKCSEYFGNVFDYAPYTKVYIYLPFIGFRELDVSQVMRSTIGVKYHGDAFTGACLAEVSVTRDGGAGGVMYTFSGDCAARYPLSHGSYMGIASAIASIAMTVANAPGATLMNVMGMHSRPTVEHSGGFTGNSGAMGIKKPYLVILRPQTAMADNYQHYTGQPANHTVALGNATGYVRVKEVHVEDIVTATDAERTMIETALKEGVLI